MAGGGSRKSANLGHTGMQINNKGVLSDSEYRKLQDAVAYAEHNLDRYLFERKAV